MNEADQFPVGTFVIIHGEGWTSGDHIASMWIKGRCGVVIGHHTERYSPEDVCGEIEVVVASPDGKRMLNCWFLPEELRLAEHKRMVPWWEETEEYKERERMVNKIGEFIGS